MAEKTPALRMGIGWADHGTSFGWDVASLLFAIALHMPLFFMKFDNHKKVTDAPNQRLVSVDLIEPELPKPVVVEPPPPPVVKKDSFMERLKAMVKKEPPPPPPVEKKPLPDKLLEAPKPIELQAKLDLPQKIEPKLESKSGFKTTEDAKLVQQKQLMMQNIPTGIAPLSAKKLGTIDDRTVVKNNKGSFQVSRNESLKGIGGDGPSLSGAAPVIAIQTGKTGSTEKFSAPLTQKTDKGKIGAIPSVGLGGGPQLGLRDSMIARDAAPSQINVGGRPGGVAGGIPGGTGSKRNAGSFNTAMAGNPSGGLKAGVSGSGIASAPRIAEIVPRKKEKQSMFTITGPLKDRKIEKQVTPEYPAWAQAQGISASVVLEFTVDPSGVVKNSIVVRRTSGYPKLDETAVQALRQWKFAPLVDAENREEVGLITFNYSLS